MAEYRDWAGQLIDANLDSGATGQRADRERDETMLNSTSIRLTCLRRGGVIANNQLRTSLNGEDIQWHR